MVATFSFRGLAIIHRATCMFMMMMLISSREWNLETMHPMDVFKVDKRIVDLIRDPQQEGRR